MTEETNKQDSQESTAIKLQNAYAAGLTTYVKKAKTSELDLSNEMEVSFHASKGVGEKQLMDQAMENYHTISKKLNGLVKTHLNQMDQSFIHKSTESGDLKFVKPSFYLSKFDVDSGEIIGPQAVTTGNTNLAYSFLMFRQVSKSKAYDFQPDYILSFFNKKTAKSYTDHDVLDTFEYLKDGLTIYGHTTTKTGSKAVNKQAADILKADVTEVKDIIKNTFSEFAYACNILRETSDYTQKTVCKSFSDVSSPDYFIELLTCLETFNLARNPALCQDMVYEDAHFEL